MPRDRTEQIIVFRPPTDHGSPFVVAGYGAGIEVDRDQGMGHEDAAILSDTPSAPGLWYWTGTPFWTDGRTSEGIDEGSEPVYHDRGVWRRLTGGELANLAAGNLQPLIGVPRLTGEEVPEDDGLLVNILGRAGPPPPAPAPPPLVPRPMPVPAVYNLLFVPVALQTDQIITDPVEIERVRRATDEIAAALERDLANIDPSHEAYADAVKAHRQALAETYLAGRRTILVKRRIL